MPLLIQRLELIKDQDLTLANTGIPSILVRLIPALPEDIQANSWHRILSEVTISEWQSIIPLINDQLGFNLCLGKF